MNRTAYQNWDIQDQAAKVFLLAEEVKNAYKASVLDPANTKAQVDANFAQANLFWNEKDLWYSDYQFLNPAYVDEFLDYDNRLPFRDRYVKTEVGVMFPHIVKAEDIPQPGQPLVWKKREPVNIWQDESAPLPDLHFRNVVDFRIFDYATHFLDSTSHANITNAIFDAMRRGNARIEKLWVDTFIASLLGLWSYPMGSVLFRFFTDDDSYTPDEQYSKVARQFYLKDGEIRKNLTKLKAAVKEYYKNRIPYLTNINTSEIIGQSLDRTIPKWDKALADRSDKTKTLAYVRKCFLAEDKNKKYTESGYLLRRLSVDCLAAMVFKVIDRMMTENAFNFCGHEYGKDMKEKEGMELRCKPENLLVLMNNEDLSDVLSVLGSQIKGAFTETSPHRGKVEEYLRMGVRFYGVDFILPSMAIVLDKVAFRFVEYLNESYSHFHEYDIVNSTVHHMMKKPVLYKKVACQVIELAEGQKYALPIGWASEHLPYIRDNS